MHPARIEISQSQFLANIRAIRQHVGPKVKFCLPVKANAYGHGLVGMSRLAEPYVDYLAVACLDEGALLRKNGIKKPILVFGAIDEEQIPGLLANDLEITIPSLYKAKLLANYCQNVGKRRKVQIKVDSGMNRIGIRAGSFADLADFILACPWLELTGVYSHFAASDEVENSLTQQQIDLFKKIVTHIKSLKPSVLCHIANSAGICYFPDSYLDMVRPGILSYGYASRAVGGILEEIKPCFSLKARVSYFKVVLASQGVSYNHRYTVGTELTRVITLPIGYGDGYRRGLSNKGEVLLNAKRYRISGSVCMDMLMIDIGASGQAYVGDEVVLIGKQGAEEILAVELAALLDTIVYEVLTGFTERIPRILIA